MNGYVRRLDAYALESSLRGVGRNGYDVLVVICDIGNLVAYLKRLVVAGQQVESGIRKPHSRLGRNTQACAVVLVNSPSVHAVCEIYVGPGCLKLGIVHEIHELVLVGLAVVPVGGEHVEVVIPRRREHGGVVYRYLGAVMGSIERKDEFNGIVVALNVGPKYGIGENLLGTRRDIHERLRLSIHDGSAIFLIEIGCKVRSARSAVIHGVGTYVCGRIVEYLVSDIVHTHEFRRIDVLRCNEHELIFYRLGL